MKHLRDDFFERWVFNGDVVYGEGVEDFGEDFGDLLFGYFERDPGWIDFDKFAESFESGVRLAECELELNDFKAREFVGDTTERAVVLDDALSDHHDPFAQSGDIFHVVASQ